MSVGLTSGPASLRAGLPLYSTFQLPCTVTRPSVSKRLFSAPATPSCKRAVSVRLFSGPESLAHQGSSTTGARRKCPAWLCFTFYRHRLYFPFLEGLSLGFFPPLTPFQAPPVLRLRCDPDSASQSPRPQEFEYLRLTDSHPAHSLFRSYCGRGGVVRRCLQWALASPPAIVPTLVPGFPRSCRPAFPLRRPMSPVQILAASKVTP